MGWKAGKKLIRHRKILRGDNVMIIIGKEKGETGIVGRVIRSQNRVVVEGKNLVKRHIKQGQGHEAGPKDTSMDVVLEKTYDEKTGLGMPDL